MGIILGAACLQAQGNAGRSAISSPFLTYEDTSVLERGGISVSQYSSLDNSRGSKSVSAPGVDFSLGLTDRLELSGFGAISSSRKEGEHYVRGADDGYLGVKFLVREEGRYMPALAFRPMLQFLADTGIGGRVHVALPLIVERDVKFCKLAYTIGYITSGAGYSSVKCEWNSNGMFTPLAVVSASRAITNWGDLREQGLNRTQLYGSAGINVNLTPHWSLFVEAGRNLGRKDDNSSRFGFTASISYTGFLWGRSSDGQQIPKGDRRPFYGGSK
jgi:hypothetical protein